MSVIILREHCIWRGSTAENDIQLWFYAFEDHNYIAILVRPEY